MQADIANPERRKYWLASQQRFRVQTNRASTKDVQQAESAQKVTGSTFGGI